MGIGRSLCVRALKHYLAQDCVSKIQFGSDIPSIFPGIPSKPDSKAADLRVWVEEAWVTSRIYSFFAV
jgi:hypothetical protein